MQDWWSTLQSIRNKQNKYISTHRHRHQKCGGDPYHLQYNIIEDLHNWTLVTSLCWSAWNIIQCPFINESTQPWNQSVKVFRGKMGIFIMLGNRLTKFKQNSSRIQAELWSKNNFVWGAIILKKKWNYCPELQES